MKYRCIKTSLNSICCTTDIIKIEQIVKKCNLIMNDLYMFIKLYILHQYKYNQLIELDHSKLLAILNTITNRDKRGRKFKCKKMAKYIHRVHDEYINLINHNKFDRTNLSHIFNYLIDEILINMKNNIVFHFCQHLRNYIKFYFITNKVKYVKKDIGKAIFMLYEGSKIDWANVDNFNANCVVKHIRSEIINISVTPNKHIGYLLKEYPYIFLVYMLDFADRIEKFNNNFDIQFTKSTSKFEMDLHLHRVNKLNKINKTQHTFDKFGIDTNINKLRTFRMYQCIPMKSSLIPNYITIDTAIIIDILEISNKNHSLRSKDTRELLWHDHFPGLYKNKFISQNKRFHYLLSTDGIGVSLIYRGKKVKRTKFPKHEEDIYTISKWMRNKIKKMTIVGVDPGKRNIITMTDGNNKLRYTNVQRRFECHFKKNMLKIHSIKNKDTKIKSIERIYSKFNMKTVDISKHIENMNIRYKFIDYVENHYGKRVYRRMKFDRYIHTQKSESNLMNEITKRFGNNVCLAYGNYSNNYHMKGCLPTIGIGLRNKLNKKFKMIIVDEYKTSKLCHCCKSENGYVLKRAHPNPNKKGNRIVHGLLRCKNVNCSKYWDRDMNGCLNIREILLSLITKNVRPSWFSRTNSHLPINSKSRS